VIEGVIFDMDGLMFDSQSVWDRLWKPALAKFGLSPTLAFVQDARGTTGDATAACIHRHFGQDADAKAIHAELERLAYEAFSHGAPAKPGLNELLLDLRRRGIPCTVASSSPRDMIVNNLRCAGVDSLVDMASITSGSDVARSKPAPDIFLEAARRLGTHPAATIVLEDSFQGVRAGAAGGFLTVMVPDLRQPTDEIRSMCASVCPTLSDVIPLLERGW
jgi:HAD superfamily hydrolase (TIGR01509 family)